MSVSFFDLLRSILATNFLPDLVAISINGLTVTRARGLDTLLIIQHAYAFFIGKLLVLWRSDEDAQQRLDMVKEFNELCHSNGLLSIIEPVVRPPRRGDKFCREQAIIDAAKELGDSGADLYKVEMPLYGKGTQQELLSASQRLNENINMPWVILSSGVDEKLFPRAVSVAMTAGASGFLAGRAVWSSVVGLPDTELMLRDVSAPKLQRLGDIVDEMMARR